MMQELCRHDHNFTKSTFQHTKHTVTFLYFITYAMYFQVIQGKVKENYNMDMWIKQCDRGVASCYIAQVKRVKKIKSL